MSIISGVINWQSFFLIRRARALPTGGIKPRWQCARCNFPHPTRAFTPTPTRVSLPPPLLPPPVPPTPFFEPPRAGSPGGGSLGHARFHPGGAIYVTTRLLCPPRFSTNSQPILKIFCMFMYHHNALWHAWWGLAQKNIFTKNFEKPF